MSLLHRYIPSSVYLMQNEFSVFLAYDPGIFSSLVHQQEYHPSFNYESDNCHICDWTLKMREKQLDLYTCMDFGQVIEEDVETVM